MRIVNATRGTVLADKADVATTMGARMRGLMWRPQLEAGRGLVLRPTQAIHTFMMAFPIDVLFVDTNLTVVHMIEKMEPSRLSPFVRQAQAVVELPAGTIAQTATRPGDTLALE